VQSGKNRQHLKRRTLVVIGVKRSLQMQCEGASGESQDMRCALSELLRHLPCAIQDVIFRQDFGYEAQSQRFFDIDLLAGQEESAPSFGPSSIGQSTCVPSFVGVAGDHGDFEALLTEGADDLDSEAGAGSDDGDDRHRCVPYVMRWMGGWCARSPGRSVQLATRWPELKPRGLCRGGRPSPRIRRGRGSVGRTCARSSGARSRTR